MISSSGMSSAVNVTTPPELGAQLLAAIDGRAGTVVAGIEARRGSCNITIHFIIIYIDNILFYKIVSEP